MVYPIVKFGDPVLEREAEDVTEFDTPELHKFLEDMFESMYAAKGVGLAAPQIGIRQEDRGHRRLQRREPGRQAGADQSRRSCTSKASRRARRAASAFPGFASRCGAAKRVTVRAQNAKGEEFEMTGEDLLARAFLHETDHLYGRLYITHISALKRDLMKRKIKKLQRAGEWG